MFCGVHILQNISIKSGIMFSKNLRVGGVGRKLILILLCEPMGRTFKLLVMA